MPGLKTGVGHLIAVTDAHLDQLSHLLQQVDVEIAAQKTAFDLATQLHIDGRQHAGHPDGHVGIVAVGDLHLVIGEEQGDITVLIRLDALQFHVTHTHRAVFALQHEILQIDVVQAVVFSDNEETRLLCRHIVDSNSDNRFVIRCMDSNGCHGNKQ